MNKIDKIIELVRLMQEESVPTNNASSGAIAGLPPDQPPIDLRKGRRRYWNPFFKELAQKQKRK